jgi:hypothetical protein
MEKEERVEIWARIPKRLREWLKDSNLNASELISRLLKEEYEKVMAEQRKERTWEEIWETFSPKLQMVMSVRERLFLSPTERSFKYRQEIEQVETAIRTGHSAEQIEQHSGAPKEIVDYAKSVLTLSESEYNRWKETIQLHDDEISRLKAIERYEGDPSEVVYRHVTRRMIYDTLYGEKEKPRSVMEIAAALKLTYFQAWENVVPWLLGNGWNVVRKKSQSNVHT